MSITVPIKVPVQVPIKVMYFGMAIDIVGPMQLVPDFDTIYTINIVDKCAGFGGSIKNIIKMIKLIYCHLVKFSLKKRYKLKPHHLLTKLFKFQMIIFTIYS